MPLADPNQTTAIRVVGFGGSIRSGSTSLSALQHALDGARARGAVTELLAVSELDLPIYDPARPRGEHNPSLHRLLAGFRNADAMIWSSPGYHGTVSGAFKNALDYLQFLATDNPPYLTGRRVGLITTAGGHVAAANAINAMIHAAHALRATPTSLQAPIGKASTVFSNDGKLRDTEWTQRLHQLGALVAQFPSHASNQQDAESTATQLPNAPGGT